MVARVGYIFKVVFYLLFRAIHVPLCTLVFNIEGYSNYYELYTTGS